MQKLINAGLILTSFFCYLEWGGNNSGFLFSMLYELLFRSAHPLDGILHPAVSLPLTGQFLLLITLFQKIPGKWLSLAGLILLSLLVLFILFIGILAVNFRTIASTLPFLFFAVWFFVHRRRMKFVAQPAA